MPETWVYQKCRKFVGAGPGGCLGGMFSALVYKCANVTQATCRCASSTPPRNCHVIPTMHCCCTTGAPVRKWTEKGDCVSDHIMLCTSGALVHLLCASLHAHSPFSSERHGIAQTCRIDVRLVDNLPVQLSCYRKALHGGHAHAAGAKYLQLDSRTACKLPGCRLHLQKLKSLGPVGARHSGGTRSVEPPSYMFYFVAAVGEAFSGDASTHLHASHWLAASPHAAAPCSCQ